MKFPQFSSGSMDELQDKSLKYVTITSLQIFNYWPLVISPSNSKVISTKTDVSQTSLRSEATFCHLLRNYWRCMEVFTEVQHGLL
jgi:hypothetical protein